MKDEFKHYKEKLSFAFLDVEDIYIKLEMYVANKKNI